MQRATITEFINLYRDRPCLWNNKLPQYSNKHIRNKALNDLLEILHKIEPNANIYSVRKKIDNLRTMYNRERRKVMFSERSGFPPNMVYEPTLWYFKQMSFLNKLESPVNVDDLKQESLVEDTGDSVEENNEMAQEAHEVLEVPIPPKRPRQSVIKVRQQKFLKKTTKERDAEDELDCFSKMAAKTLRKLEEPTQSIALKLMSDVLYHAKMGHLTEQSGISTPANTHVTEVPCSTEQVTYINDQTPIYSPKSPNYINNSNYNTNSPNYITQSPTYITTSPNYTAKASKYIKSPTYITTSPNYTPKSPVYAPSSPHYNVGDSPIYRPSSPNYGVK